tara:strand:- start:1030 stop:1851 length:822 start_codon:yes stop_codon:yes gene_type:complete
MSHIKRFSIFYNESVIEPVTESVGQAGLDYELRVWNAMSSAKIAGLNVGDKPTTAGFSNQGAGDIEGSYQGDPLNIEVKASAKDQMGGTSFQYSMDTKTFTPTKEMDQDDLDLFMPIMKEKAKDIDNYIKASWQEEPKQFHKNNHGVPIKVSIEARDKLKKKGLTAKIATNIKAPVSFIIKHYNKKGVYYIQIGGAGLFYMGKNPFNLPVPELKAEIQVELGLRFGGGKLKFPTEPEPTLARSAGLRIQGRLLTKSKSPYSLDNVEDVKKLFS